MLARRPSRRPCVEPRKRRRLCRSVAGRQATLLLARRARSGCRVRQDFTGRGFGGVRLREAR